LSLDRIVTATLELVDEQGVGAASMRAVSSRLGVRSMSPYRYVRDRDELFDAELRRSSVRCCACGLAPAAGTWLSASVVDFASGGETAARRCPCHGSVFRLSDGSVHAGPPRHRSRYPTPGLAAGEIQVRLPGAG
jgi:hypothetical protein